MPTRFAPPQTPSLGIRVVRRGPKHPYFKADFRVFIGDKEIGIQSISPLHLEDPDPVDGDIILKRGMVLGDNEMFEWFKSVKMGAVELRDITISLLNESHEAVAAWKLSNAWIKKLVGPTLDAQGNSVAIEEMVLSCDEITIENG